MRRHRERRIELGKALFVLPNLFTLGVAFTGFYSMLLASQATRPWDYWAAAWVICLGAALDGVDGRVARLTRTQSRFGLELDSLSDNVAFGLAPAWLVYHWGLSEWWPGGLVVAFAYAACCSIRLARFNLLAAGHADPRFFTGLPSPIGAILLAGLVGVSAQRGIGPAHVSHPLVVVTILAIGVLLVSNIRFRSFKRVRLRSRRTLFALSLFAAAIGYVGMLTTIETALTGAVVAYVALHLATATVRLERRLLGRRDEPEDESDDDDILAALADDDEDDVEIVEV